MSYVNNIFCRNFQYRDDDGNNYLHRHYYACYIDMYDMVPISREEKT